VRRKFSKSHKRVAVAIALFGSVVSIGLWAIMQNISWPMMGLLFTMVGVWSVRDHARAFGELSDD